MNLPQPSERLYFRPLELTDVDALLPYHSDPEVVRYIPWPARDRDQVVEWVGRFKDKITFENEGDYFNLAMIRKEDDQLIGQINAGYKSAENQRAEIGYVINPSFGGRGYATEATAALVTWLFSTGLFHRVTAHLDARNPQSAALLERLGFRREAHFIEDEFFKGEWSSSYEYAILQSEWRRRKRV